MTIRDQAIESSKPLPWLMRPAVLPFWFVAVEWGWWRVFASAVASAPAGGSLSASALAAAVALLGKALGHLSEAAYYVLLWRARGSRLPFWRFLVVVVSASLADQLAYGISRGASAGEGLGWRAWVAGLHVANGTPFHDSPGLRAAFGSLSVLSATRLGITAAAQVDPPGRGAREAVAWTLATWLLTRIAALWSVDLLRGMSPLSGG